MKNFICLVVAILLAVLPSSSFAENKGGTLVFSGEKVAVKPMSPPSERLVKSFIKYKMALGSPLDSKSGMFVCEGERCVCDGLWDCEWMELRGVCAEPGEWECHNVDGTPHPQCSCLAKVPSPRGIGTDATQWLPN